MTTSARALTGLRVVTTANALPAALAGQVLADAGAEVWLLEPPTGSPLRQHGAWEFWARGSRSLRVDLTTAAGRDTARALIRASDVFIDGWGTGVATRLGLDRDALRAENPRLVHARISAFGDESPWAGEQGWESVVMAVAGGASSFTMLSGREGPAYVSTPYCSVGAAHLALHGILGALLERQRSGHGQCVSATLAQALASYDTWNWLLHVLAERYDSSFAMPAPYDLATLTPNTPFFFRLLVGLTKDGEWLQFSQITDRLWAAFLRACHLDPADPAIHDAPLSEDPAARILFWETLLAAVRSRTVAQWQEVFNADPDVWGEQFRVASEGLSHPQLVADGRVATTTEGHPVAGPLALSGAWPVSDAAPAPSLGADNDLVVTLTPARAVAAAPGDEPALDGITIIELGTFFAAPFGATLLAEQGARVIKIESPDGDAIRNVVPFPELAGVKVLHGKESIILDTTTDAGRAVLAELVRGADVVLQGYRAGVAQRIGATAEELLALNPELVYVSAPGYGTDGPCGHRPAFAPTMGAASGLAIRNLGGADVVPRGPDLSLDVVKHTAMRLACGAMSVANADGFAGLGVATSILLGLLSRELQGGGLVVRTSMLSTMAHSLADSSTCGGQPTPVPDARLLGIGVFHRLYETAQGWVMLTATTTRQQAAAALELGVSLEDAAVGDQIEEVLLSAPAEVWHKRLAMRGVTCVPVSPQGIERTIMLGSFGREHGFVTTGVHATLDEYPRSTALTGFSRSQSVLGPAPLCGEHTESVLAELAGSA
jgi:crotonobetainyl-CoA:carnitine CoA-transferase CaiB-like acyl-CoA transferase